LIGLLQAEPLPQQMYTAPVGRRVHGVRHQLGRFFFEKFDQIRLFNRLPMVTVVEVVAGSSSLAFLRQIIRRSLGPIVASVFIQTAPARGRS